MKRYMALALTIGMHACASDECNIVTPLEKDIQTSWFQRMGSRILKNIYNNGRIAAVVIPLTVSASSKALAWWSELLAQKSSFAAARSAFFLGTGLKTINVKLIAPVAAVYLACVAIEEGWRFALLKHLYRERSIEEAKRIYGEKRLDELEAYITSFDANIRHQFIRFALAVVAAIGVLKLS